MPDIGKLLKEEIRRVALRSARPLHAKLKKDLAQLKRSCAALKKENSRLLKDVERLQGHLRGTLHALPQISEKKLENMRIGPKLVLAQRKRLGLSRVEFAKLLGASAGAVVSWESGRVRPRENMKAALAGVRKLGRRAAREKLRLLSGS